MSNKFDDDDPEVIRARADAKAKILEARSKMHPLAQLLYTFLDGIGELLTGIGCLLIIAIIVIALFSPMLSNLVNLILHH